MQAAWLVFSAFGCLGAAGKGNVLMLVPPEGFYCSRAAGLGSEIRKKENQGVSKEKEWP